MDKKQIQKRVNKILEELYLNSDQDECGIKHIGHGTSMLFAGLDPSIQGNYIDYCHGGYIPTGDVEDYDSYVRAEFRQDLWRELKDLYDMNTEVVMEPSDACVSLYIGSYLEDYLQKIKEEDYSDTEVT